MSFKYLELSNYTAYNTRTVKNKYIYQSILALTRLYCRVFASLNWLFHFEITVYEL